eukprot:4988007-Amphidinium_carterae.3
MKDMQDDMDKITEINKKAAEANEGPEEQQARALQLSQKDRNVHSMKLNYINKLSIHNSGTYDRRRQQAAARTY